MIVRPALAVCLWAAGATAAAGEESAFSISHGDVAVIGGYDSPDSGLDNRASASAFANLYMHGGLGLHAEVAGITREEDAVFFAGGLSYNSQPFSAKAVLGSSTDNETILPDFYARGEATFRTDPGFGLSVTPSASYRRFRNEVEETSAGLNFTKYFALPKDRQVVVQVFGAANIADPGNNLGGYGAVDLTYGKYKRWSVGSTFEIGRSSFTSLVAATSVQSDYFSIRPHAGVYVSDNVEVFAQLAYYNTETFDLVGGGIGVKFAFGTPGY